MTICSLCGRHLLVGEQFQSWHPAHGAGAGLPVCSLCEHRAVSAGWERASPDRERQGTPAPVWTVRLVA